MADKYVSVHTGAQIDAAITKVRNLDTTDFNDGNIPDAGAVKSRFNSINNDLTKNYAKKKGHYEQFVAGYADNLTPFSEDSGNTQTVPFNFQGTACGNGESIVDTGTFAQLKEKRGNSVIVDQLILNPNFVDSTGWQSGDTSKGTIAVSNGELAYTVIEPGVSYSNGFFSSSFGVPHGHKLVIIGTFKASRAGITLGGDIQNKIVTLHSNLPTSYTTISVIFEKTADGNSNYFCTRGGAQVGDIIYAKNIYLIDLTKWFGSNDAIPAHVLSHPEDFGRYYQGSLAFNEGSLTNANATVLKMRRRNLWDEEWEVGRIGASTGANVDTGYDIRSKNYIRISPNDIIYALLPPSGNIFFYDVDKNYIGNSGGMYSGTLTAPSNCFYIRFCTYAGSGYTTYNNDITFSLYYVGESGYDQHYPYEVLDEVDTGSEVLRSAGNAYDVKVSSGEITRNVSEFSYNGSKVVLDGVEYTPIDKYTSQSASDGSYTFAFQLSGGADEYIATSSYKHINNYGLASDNPWSGVNRFYLFTNNGVLTCGINISGYTTVAEYDTLFSSRAFIANVRKINPTTEQGTSFEENIKIDDFGTMEFISTNGVPQGNKIFYAVDYKGGLDTLNNFLNGDMTNITKLVGEGESLAPDDPTTAKGILDEIRALYAINQENQGDTLRHILIDRVTAGGGALDFNDTTWADLGELDDWYYVTQEAQTFFQVTLPNAKSQVYTSLNGICSKYAIKPSAAGWGVNMPDKSFGLSLDKIRIKDTGYSDAATFKAAMKGILVAYEKAAT